MLLRLALYGTWGQQKELPECAGGSFHVCGVVYTISSGWSQCDHNPSHFYSTLQFIKHLHICYFFSIATQKFSEILIIYFTDDSAAHRKEMTLPKVIQVIVRT